MCFDGRCRVTRSVVGAAGHWCPFGNGTRSFHRSVGVQPTQPRKRDLRPGGRESTVAACLSRLMSPVARAKRGKQHEAI